MIGRWQHWNSEWFLYHHIPCTSPYPTGFCQFSGSFHHQKSAEKHLYFGDIPFIKAAPWWHQWPLANQEQRHSTASLSVPTLQRRGDVLRVTSPCSPESPPDFLIAAQNKPHCSSHSSTQTRQCLYTKWKSLLIHKATRKHSPPLKTEGPPCVCIFWAPATATGLGDFCHRAQRRRRIALLNSYFRFIPK